MKLAGDVHLFMCMCIVCVCVCGISNPAIWPYHRYAMSISLIGWTEKEKTGFLFN